MQHFQRPLAIETLESRQLLAGDAFGFKNPLVHQDVDNDEVITPMDVLLIANRLNGNAGDHHVRHFLDVDGDEDITATDGQDRGTAHSLFTGIDGQWNLLWTGQVTQ